MLLDKIKEYDLILASASPRRQELLKSIGLDFRQLSGLDADESYPDSLPAKEIALHIARNKSHAYKNHLESMEILITADTIVAKDELILHKPANEEEAFESLEKLAGSSHRVFTGVCLRSKGKEIGFTAETEVLFGTLTAKEINYYIQTAKPFDKAGAYGIQEWIGFVGVEEIHGSYFNVMGLPIHQLYRQLENFIK